MGIKAMTVVQDTAAVIIFIKPKIDTTAARRGFASTRCPRPQERMNAPNNKKSDEKGTSRRLRTKKISTQGMAI